jgi:hypothetical protein
VILADIETEFGAVFDAALAARLEGATVAFAVSATAGVR